MLCLTMLILFLLMPQYVLSVCVRISLMWGKLTYLWIFVLLWCSLRTHLIAVFVGSISFLVSLSSLMSSLTFHLVIFVSLICELCSPLCYPIAYSHLRDFSWVLPARFPHFLLHHFLTSFTSALWAFFTEVSALSSFKI